MDMLIMLSQLNENKCGKGAHWYYDIFALLNSSVFIGCNDLLSVWYVFYVNK